MPQNNVEKNSPARTDGAIVRPQGSSQARRRSAILEATRHLCRNIGYEATTMDAVAHEAGVTKPTLYAYFSNKEELAVEAFVESVEGRIALIDHMPESLSPLERFKRTLRYILEEKISGEQIVLAWPGPPIATHPRFQGALQTLVDRSVALLRAGQECGDANPALDPDIVVHTYVGILTDPRLEILLRSRQTSPEAAIETLYAILIGGLQTPG